MTENNSQHQGSFLTGFTVGLFAGAAGYFLFGTSQGKKVTDRLNEEWENAKEKLAEEGVIDHSDVSLRQVIGQVLTQVKEKIETQNSHPAKTDKSVKSSTPKAAKKPVKKFKNISL